LELKTTSIWTIFVRSATSIWTTLASSATLKVLVMEGMAGSNEEGGALKHNSFSSVVVTVAVASSMLLYSKSSAHWAMASMVMMPEGPGIFNMR
jgi:hypothetical protein